MRIFTLLLVVLVALPAHAQGDEVRLKNGAVIQGRIVRDDKDAIVIDVGRGRMNLLRRDVVSVTLGRTEPVDSPATPPTTEGPKEAPQRRVVARETSTQVAPPPPRRGGREFVPAPSPRIVPVERVATPDRTPIVDGPEAPVTSKKAVKGSESKSHGRPGSSKPTAKTDW